MTVNDHLPGCRIYSGHSCSCWAERMGLDKPTKKAKPEANGTRHCPDCERLNKDNAKLQYDLAKLKELVRLADDFRNYACEHCIYGCEPDDAYRKAREGVTL